MLKKIIAGAVVALALPMFAFAANFTNVQFDNGDVTISGQGGSTVNATFHITVPANQVVEYIQTDVTGDNLAPVCTSVGGDLGLQEGTHDISLPVKLPPNTGTYTLTVQGAGTYGGIRSVDCNDNVVGNASFSGALRVVSDDTNTTTGSDNGSSAPSWLAQLIASLVSVLKPATTTAGTTATASPACAELSSDLLGAQMGIYNQANVRLQGFLLGKGASIPALAAGASFGFYGPQTQSAIAWFNSSNNCN